MAQPCESDRALLNRLGRYLIDARRCRTLYEYQHAPRELIVWVDSDSAGCSRTRKSTSDGVARLGSHTLKGWMSTQGVVAFSSGDTEFYAMDKGGSMGLGFQNLRRAWA